MPNTSKAASLFETDASGHLYFSCPFGLSGPWSNFLEVLVLAGLAAHALTGHVLGGLNCDWHYIGGWRKVRITLSWHLPLWHNVEDGCDREMSEVLKHTAITKIWTTNALKNLNWHYYACVKKFFKVTLFTMFFDLVVIYFTKITINTWFSCSSQSCFHKKVKNSIMLLLMFN